MIDMVNKDILPAVSGFAGSLACDINSRKSAISGIDCTYEEETLLKLSKLINKAYKTANLLEKKVSEFNSTNYSLQKTADFCKSDVIPVMETLRDCVDAMEDVTDRKCWPYPTYGDLLFGVK